MLNVVIMLGRIVADPDFKVVGEGDKQFAAAKYRIAVERNYIVKGVHQVDYFFCKAFRGKAEYAKKYFHKGDLVVVRANLFSEQYKTEEGIKWITGLNVEENYLAKSSNSEIIHNRQMIPSQDAAGTFIPGSEVVIPEQPDEIEYPPLPADEDIPVFPEDAYMPYN